MAEGAPAGGDIRAILIAGPTASGKSALALALAERLDGTVINADSMQVYDTLRILTARPGPDDAARAPHRLYGHVPIATGYSVGRWLEDVAGALDEAGRERRMPIVVGGTGLYFRALTEGISPVPEVPEEIRNRVRARLAAEGAAALHRELGARDPVAVERIRASDPQRIARALEVVEATGRPLSEWQAEEGPPPLVRPETARRLVLWPDRAAVRARIDARVGEMLEAGALEEVRAAMALNLDPALPGSRAHGLRPLIAHLRGEMSLDEACERTRAETRQYAKRQFTWLRHQLADWERVDPERIAEIVADPIPVAEPPRGR